jgi:hypothetical protein
MNDPPTCTQGLRRFEHERVELIDGALITRSPAGSFHDATIARLPPAQRHRRPEPDLLVVPDGDSGVAYPQSAHLVVEGADSSLEYDPGGAI